MAWSPGSPRSTTRLAATAPESRPGFRRTCWPQLPDVSDESFDALEDTLLAGMAGVRGTERANASSSGRGAAIASTRRAAKNCACTACASARAVRRCKRRSRARSRTRKPGGDRVLADTLTSILYAASLGDPEGPALAGGNVALRHDLGAAGVMGPRCRVAAADRRALGQGLARVTGSLLGLDVALARLSLRRLDSSLMPPEPRTRLVGAADRVADRRLAEPARAQRRRARRDRRRPGARPRATRRPSTAERSRRRRGRRATRA